MKRSARLTDFLLVTVAVTTILLSLWPLSAKQQSPSPELHSTASVFSSRNSPTTVSAGEVELGKFDPAKAVANWQDEVASFYALRDAETKSIVATSKVQTVSYNQPVAEKLGITARQVSTRPPAEAMPRAHFGVVLQDQHVPMTFFFAICGGALLGLGYLDWSRQAPAVQPTAIQFHDADDEVTNVAFDSKWGVVHQSKAVAVRRATLGGVVLWALASLLL